MPSKRPVTLLRRGRSWALRRAVPREFHGVEPRRVITKTLSATTEAGASKEAQRFWNGLLRQWRRATSGVGAGYLARLDEARQAADDGIGNCIEIH